ncbi:MAG: hypothetical protein IPH16_00010 [Haliscomenobacter sp.]|nr:hypothetical protein [Haliscomenobacter sp.]
MPAALFWKSAQFERSLLSVHYVKVNTRSLDGDLEAVIEETLPGLGIKKRTGAGMEASPFDLLENYPLPEKYKPELEALPPPYVGVTYFTADEAFLFFGRDLDILSLINKVESSESSRKILLYRNLSGVGKSSIPQCRS